MPGHNNDEKWMRLALSEAKKAAEHGEVPVGAVLVCEERAIATAHNLCKTQKDPTAHAELLAIRAACEALGSERLRGCTLYVTLEPCPMCTGSFMNARVSRVVFGARDPRAGACGSLFCLPAYPYDTAVTVEGGLMEEEALRLLQDFFRGRREKN